MTLEKVFLQVGRELDSYIAQARRTINQAIAADLNNLVAEGNGLPKRRGPAPKFTVRGKPGPKPKNPQVTAAVKGKPGPKPKAQTTDSPVARGRRAVANGNRPKVVDAVASVIGHGQTMTAKEVVDALASRGWMPDSEKPQNYINFILSSHRDVFERVSHGNYRVIKGVKVSRQGKAQGDTSQTESSEEEEVSAAGVPAVDEELDALGIGQDGKVAPNPFPG